MARIDGKAHFTATSQGVSIFVRRHLFILEGVHIFYYYCNFEKQKKH